MGLEYKPKLNDLTPWGGEDDPMKNCSWNTPMDFSAKRTDESIRNSIHSKIESLLERNKATKFRVEVYKATDVEILCPDYENAYLLFIFWARGN